MIYHILNGDALKEQFPEDILGERIVARECLVDGDVQGASMYDLFVTRAKFIGQSYAGCSEEDYYRNTVPEFEKISNIAQGAEINLWFEDDLFCQVNCWFVLHLLSESIISENIYLVRPSADMQYGFGGMTQPGLIDAFQQRTKIDQPTFLVLRKLWKLYQGRRHQEMIEQVDHLEDQFGFVKAAIQAEIDRYPLEGEYGRPQQVLLDIMTELPAADFGTVFREFGNREAIYGFGDLQVKRLFDEIKNNG
jgi:hypothetical protein